MKTLTILTLIGATLMLSACSSHKIERYAQNQPELKLEEYFTGEIKAWGIIQDWRGRATNHFDVTMVGTWEGNVGTLEEDFDYYEGNAGKATQRTWTITKLGEGQYKGTAGDIVGEATGATSGNAAQWKYQMDLPINGRMIRLTFDDWMFLMQDGVLINRSYIKKFGITVAELTLFMQKQDDDSE